MRYSILCVVLFLLSACNFLEEYSLDTVYVRSYEDLEELLLGEGYMYADYGRSLEDGYLYYPYIHYMQDETEECESSPWGGNAFERRDAIFGYYTWQNRCGVDAEGTSFADESKDWTQLYYHVNVVNSVIDVIDQYIQGSDEERKEGLRVKGEAYFLRGAYYFTLVNLYGKPYNKATAASDLGVPVKLTGEVQDVIFERENVASVYKQILADLEVAEECLGQALDAGTIYQADSTAVHLLLSRVHLYMQNWEQALIYANKVIAARPELVDLNGFSGGFLSKSSVETIFSMGGNSVMCNTVNQYKSFQVSHELYDSFKEGDLRKNVFFWTYGDFIGYTKVAVSQYGSWEKEPDDPEYYNYHYALAYETKRSEISDKWLLRTAEAYLNGAEAAAMLGQETEAKRLLEILLEKRWSPDYLEPVDFTGEDLVNYIREERRRELCLEGHRWFDLRRYTVCEKWPYSKEIEKVYYVYKDRNSTEKIEKRTYKLEKNDPAYTLPIPFEVLEFHTGMQDNVHPVRNYIAEPIN